MDKDFDEWNEVKKAIHRDENAKFYHAREVWWCSLGVNIGFEQDGTGKGSQRPVLILKGLSRNTCLVIPLTRSSHVHKYRFQVGKVAGENASVILSQMRVLDTKRLINRVCFIEKSVFENIRKAAKDML